MRIKNNEKIAFLGDSITEQGWSEPSGYVRLVVDGLKAAGIDVIPIPAGIGGHRSSDMLWRIDRDVISKNPDWMTLSCGLNDIIQTEKNVPLEDFKKNITKIVEKAEAVGIKVVLLTATPFSEGLLDERNQTLAPYNDFLRALARGKNLLLVDLNVDICEARKATGNTDPKEKIFTTDNVHMTPAGNAVLARGILRAFGIS